MLLLARDLMVKYDTVLWLGICNAGIDDGGSPALIRQKFSTTPMNLCHVILYKVDDLFIPTFSPQIMQTVVAKVMT